MSARSTSYHTQPASSQDVELEHAAPLSGSSLQEKDLPNDNNGFVKTDASSLPYSIYTKREKWVIVALASLGGLFSPMTANIYFPVLPTLTKAFHKSNEDLNLTVTMYMIMQGISPMIWGGGVIGDIATPQERGGFFGMFSVGPNIGPNLGPVLGGVLSQRLGWRSIFWFLCIGSALCAIVMILILPETLRSIVSDGSVKPPFLWRPLFPVIGKSIEYTNKKPPAKPLRNPFILFTYPDVIMLLVFNGVLYAVFYGVIATMSELFEDAYPSLNTTEVGLCYLAIGGGMMLGTISNGKLLDYNYRAIKRSIIRKAQQDSDGKVGWEELVKDDKFPIERARLSTAFVYTAFFVACTIGYGWCIQAKVHISGPLILQFVIGWTIMSCMNTVTTLIVDLFPTQGSSITACNNLVRCSLGAAMVSATDPIISAVGPGWTYVILGGLSVAVLPCLFIEIVYGPKWREQRRRKLAQQEDI